MQSSDRGRWRRRIPFYLLVCGMAALVAQHLAQQPVEVQVTYHYDGLSTGLRAVSLEYQHDEAVVAQARFGYKKGPAEDDQRHAVKLPPGDYMVLIELRYDERRLAEQAMRQLERARIVDGTAVALTRPLIVRQKGRAHIYF